MWLAGSFVFDRPAPELRTDRKGQKMALQGEGLYRAFWQVRPLCRQITDSVLNGIRVVALHALAGHKTVQL